MGLYDRDYGRDDQYGQAPGIRLDGPRSLTTNIVLITAGAYLLQLFIEGFTDLCLLPSNWSTQPWQAYRLLTYGFMHDPQNMSHIVVNMLVFWMFGRDLERKYGAREFLFFYLSAIVLAGIGWSLCEALDRRYAEVVGASGGVSAVFALYALNFPHRKVLFMFLIPMPIWIAALIMLLIDAQMAMDRSGMIAGSAHIAGSLYGVYYFFSGVSPIGWFSEHFLKGRSARKPKLRVHDPDDDDELSDTDQRVDEILAKIQAQGQDSLTWRERRILEKASKEYQRKRQ